MVLHYVGSSELNFFRFSFTNLAQYSSHTPNSLAFPASIAITLNTSLSFWLQSTLKQGFHSGLAASIVSEANFPDLLPSTSISNFPQALRSKLSAYTSIRSMFQQLIIADMKNQIVTHAFENLFQLIAEPIYVASEAPQEENLLDKRLDEPDKKNNTCGTIYSALCIVQPDGVIKVATGLYTENIELKVPGVRIQASDPGVNAILASEKFPTLVIDLPQKEDKVILEGLRFAHLCQCDKEILRWPNLKELKSNRFRGLKTGDNLNASIWLKRGTLQVDECRFSFAGQRVPNHLFPIIVVEEQGSLILARSELIGGVGSVGVFCNGGKVNIRECSFRDHAGVGVLVSGGPETSLILKNSTISKCGDGLVLNGPFASSVQNNSIIECHGVGMATFFGNAGNLINNEICKCKIGLEIQNSLPKVMKNNLLRNKEFGCIVYSKMNAYCKPHLRFNLLSENGQGGILLSGARNRAQVFNNVVSYNQRTGIKVENNAHPHIFLNEVSKNFGNGVHLSGGGTAFLEKNDVSGSTNSNMVLQGPNNIDNYVYNNRITEARGQGILLAYCQKFLIAKNEIARNYNGILAVTSVVNVEDNKIIENKCNGVMLVDNCQILLTQNQIQGNRKAGVIARSTSTARMRQNHFCENKIELIVEKGWESLPDVQQENDFAKDADVRVPGNLCALI